MKDRVTMNLCDKERTNQFKYASVTFPLYCIIRLHH